MFGINIIFDSKLPKYKKYLQFLTLWPILWFQLLPIMNLKQLLYLIKVQPTILAWISLLLFWRKIKWKRVIFWIWDLQLYKMICFKNKSKSKYWEMSWNNLKFWREKESLRDNKRMKKGWLILLYSRVGWEVKNRKIWIKKVLHSMP